MKLFYILSMLYLLISFLCYQKKNKRLNILFEIVYAIGLLFCYNTVVVSLFGLFKIGGSLLYYGIFNCLIGSLLNIISYKNKRIQKYKISFRTCALFFSILLIVFLVTYIRFSGFEAIRYESGDAAIHYRIAKHFSRELAMLTSKNSLDLIYGAFGRGLSISYINSGFLLHFFSNISSSKVFIMYDAFCLILSALLFFSTIYQISEKFFKRKYYICFILITLIYILAFPMNSMVFGFFYLGLAVVVMNLILLTFFRIDGHFLEQKIFFISILFMLMFSIFFSYYLFMPCIYLASGIYYICCFKERLINFKELLLYGVITLIIPFIIGFVYFILPGLIDKETNSIFSLVQLQGYTYDNKTPILMFLFVTVYLIYDRVFHKNKLNYFMISFYVVTGYVGLFFILYLIGYSGTYYFYKLFYLYWLFVVLFFGSRFISNWKFVYMLFLFVIFVSFYVVIKPNSSFSNFLTKSNIYSFNARTFLEDRLNFNKEEVDLMEKSMNYQDICEQKKRFLMIGDYQKNAWFYSVTGMVPVSGYLNNGEYRIHDEVGMTFKFWEGFTDYDCVVYYYEGNKINFDRNVYDVLYENETGAILKRKDNSD